jgi:hypothetical protein
LRFHKWARTHDIWPFEFYLSRSAWCAPVPSIFCKLFSSSWWYLLKHKSLNLGEI